MLPDALGGGKIGDKMLKPSVLLKYYLSVSYRDTQGVIKTYEETTEPMTEDRAYNRFVELQDKYDCGRCYYLCSMADEITKRVLEEG